MSYKFAIRDVSSATLQQRRDLRLSRTATRNNNGLSPSPPGSGERDAVNFIKVHPSIVYAMRVTDTRIISKEAPLAHHRHILYFEPRDINEEFPSFGRDIIVTQICEFTHTLPRNFPNHRILERFLASLLLPFQIPPLEDAVLLFQTRVPTKRMTFSTSVEERPRRDLKVLLPRKNTR